MSSSITLHAIVVDRPGQVLEARLCELNIAVAGRTTEQLLDEFAHAIKTHYEMAIDHKKTPFATLCSRLLDEFLDDPQLFEEMGVIDLPDHFAMALAIALHSPAPSSPHVRRMKKAA